MDRFKQIACMATALVVMCAGVNIVNAQATLSWDGDSSTDWNAADNWSFGTGYNPGASDGPPDFNDTAWFNSDTNPPQSVDLSADSDIGRVSFVTSNRAYTIGSANGSVLSMYAAQSLDMAGGNSIQTFDVDLAIMGNTLWNTRTNNSQVHVNGDVNLNSFELALQQSIGGSRIYEFHGVVSGSGGLKVDTTGSGIPLVRMTGGNTYTGDTAIEDGIVELTGTLANSNITIGSGAVSARLQGETQNGTGNDGTLKFNIVNDAADQILVLANGDLNITDLNLDFEVTGPLNNSVYVIADYTGGTLTGSAFNNVIDTPINYNLDYSYNAGTQVALVQIPEPSSLALAALGSLGLLLRPRRQSDD